MPVTIHGFRKFATAVLFFVPIFGAAQQPPVNSPLLDHLTGSWVLSGTIRGEQVTHDVQADWILDHHYVRIHEISRTKLADGKPQYEAMIFVAWNEKPEHYSCAWLDVYGGLSVESVGVAPPKENELAFRFKDEQGNDSFSNDFIYDPKTDSWEWRMDNIDKGVLKPFGRVKLSRNRGAPR